VAERVAVEYLGTLFDDPDQAVREAALARLNPIGKQSIAESMCSCDGLSA
jgi:hypothetical protein